MTDVKFSVLPT